MPLVLPDMDPCYFCALIHAEPEAWNIVDRTRLTATLLNGRQFEAGQCIVVPCRHAPTLLDLSAEEAAAVMEAARRAARAMVDAFDPDGILVYQNNGVGSGQEVPHFHLHVVPRRRGSDWGVGPPHLARLEQHRPQFDHAAVTDAKRHAAAVLRDHVRQLPQSHCRD